MKLKAMVKIYVHHCVPYSTLVYVSGLYNEPSMPMGLVEDLKFSENDHDKMKEYLCKHLYM